MWSDYAKRNQAFILSNSSQIKRIAHAFDINSADFPALTLKPHPISFSGNFIAIIAEQAAMPFSPFLSPSFSEKHSTRV